jgi:predicted NUDIX family NTP pyrophosphohydrolase
MPRTSAGIALYRRSGSGIEIFLVHFGGPFWAKKDVGGWSFPKGEHDESEDPLSAARREFREETGCEIDGDFVALDPIKQRSGKVIRLWAVEGECDPATIRSNTFSVEWPRGSGRQQQFPEIDRAGWFSPGDAKVKLVPGQTGFVDQLLERLNLPLT